MLHHPDDHVTIPCGFFMNVIPYDMPTGEVLLSTRFESKNVTLYFVGEKWVAKFLSGNKVRVCSVIPYPK